MSKIIIADDEELIRKLVCDFAAREGHTMLQASDGEEALALFAENPDTSLFILDVMMPNLDGWSCCKKIRETSNVPVIMLTARSQEFDELMGFEAGANDYVTKPFSPAVLMKRIASWIKKSSGDLTGDIMEFDGLSIDKNAHSVKINDLPVTLTLKEYNILVKLISNPDKVFSREEIISDVWGNDYDGEERTVDSHFARLRTKLGEWGKTHFKTIYGIGYKLEKPAK